MAEPIVIGIAGGIGSGKSAFAHALARQGLDVVDADTEAKEALEREDVRSRVEATWGSGVISSHGGVDRRALASIVFADEDERRRLEAILHPIVRSRCEELVSASERNGSRGVVIDAPLLFEVGLDAWCDAVVFVDADPEVRLERLSRTRGWDEAEIERREAAQLPLGEKRRRCRFVVQNNSGDLSVLEEEAVRIYDILRLEAGSRSA